MPYVSYLPEHDKDQDVVVFKQATEFYIYHFLVLSCTFIDEEELAEILSASDGMCKRNYCTVPVKKIIQRLLDKDLIDETIDNRGKLVFSAADKFKYTTAPKFLIQKPEYVYLFADDAVLKNISANISYLSAAPGTYYSLLSIIRLRRDHLEATGQDTLPAYRIFEIPVPLGDKVYGLAFGIAELIEQAGNVCERALMNRFNEFISGVTKTQYGYFFKPFLDWILSKQTIVAALNYLEVNGVIERIVEEDYPEDDKPVYLTIRRRLPLVHERSNYDTLLMAFAFGNHEFARTCYKLPKTATVEETSLFHITKLVTYCPELDVLKKRLIANVKYLPYS